MKIDLFVGIGIIGLLVILAVALYVFVLKPSEQKQKETQQENIQLATDKTVYSQDEEIVFEMTNNSEKNVYYYDLFGIEAIGDVCDWGYNISLYKKKNNKFEKLDEKQMVLSRGGASCPFFERLDENAIKTLAPKQKRTLIWSSPQIGRQIVESYGPGNVFSGEANPKMIPAVGTFKIALHYFLDKEKKENLTVESNEFEIK